MLLRPTAHGLAMLFISKKKNYYIDEYTIWESGCMCHLKYMWVGTTYRLYIRLFRLLCFLLLYGWTDVMPLMFI